MVYSGTNFVDRRRPGDRRPASSLGVLIGWYRRLAMVVEPFLTALYSTPRVALSRWCSSGSASACGRRSSSCSSTPSFPVLINTIGGVRAIDARSAARGAGVLRVGLADLHDRRHSGLGAVHPDRRPPGGRARTDRRGRRRDVRRQRRASATWSTTAARRFRPTRCFSASSIIALRRNRADVAGRAAGDGTFRGGDRSDSRWSVAVPVAWSGRYSYGQTNGRSNG